MGKSSVTQLETAGQVGSDNGASSAGTNVGGSFNTTSQTQYITDGGAILQAGETAKAAFDAARDIGAKQTELAKETLAFTNASAEAAFGQVDSIVSAIAETNKLSGDNKNQTRNLLILAAALIGLAMFSRK